MTEEEMREAIQIIFDSVEGDVGKVNALVELISSVQDAAFERGIVASSPLVAYP